MAGQRQLKNRIRSTKNIGQMTKAMEAVSAVKMRKSQEAAFAARPYALSALSILKEIRSKLSDEEHETLSPLLKKGAGKNLLVVITSDKGLAGPFNTNIVKTAEQCAKKNRETTEIIAVGKKGRDYFKKRPYPIIKEYINTKGIDTLEEIRPLSDFIQERFITEHLESVTLIYPNFISALKQEPTVRAILPLSIETLEEIVAGIVPLEGKYANMGKAFSSIETSKESSLLFEPTPKILLAKLLPSVIEVEILHAFLEASASEHSSRMIAMKNATDNAFDIVSSLTILFNKARQAAITKELSEITAGKESMQTS